MKQILLILLLFFSLTSFSQSLIGIVSSSQNNAAYIPSAEYTAIYNALDVKPIGDTVTWQGQLVDSLKAIGVWSRADIIYVTAQRTEAGSLINWKNPGTFNLTNTTAAVFTKYEGFTGASTTSEYLSTNYTPSTNGINYGQNSVTISAYCRINIDAAEAVIGAGAGQYTWLMPRNGSTIDTRIGSATTSESGTLSPDSSLGLTTVSRTSATNIDFYKNANYLVSRSNTSAGVTTGVLHVLSRNGAGYSNNQVSFILFGGAIIANQVARMNTAIEHYMDHLGKGVE